MRRVEVGLEFQGSLELSGAAFHIAQLRQYLGQREMTLGMIWHQLNHLRQIVRCLLSLAFVQLQFRLRSQSVRLAIAFVIRRELQSLIEFQLAFFGFICPRKRQTQLIVSAS